MATVLSLAKRTEKLSEQIDKFKPEVVVVATEAQAKEISSKHKDVEVLYGDDGLCQVGSKAIMKWC